MSYSHNQFPNHFGNTDIQQQFEPTYVQLDKQVSSFALVKDGGDTGGYTVGAGLSCSGVAGAFCGGCRRRRLVLPQLPWQRSRLS